MLPKTSSNSSKASQLLGVAVAPESASSSKASKILGNLPIVLVPSPPDDSLTHHIGMNAPVSEKKVPPRISMSIRARSDMDKVHPLSSSQQHARNGSGGTIAKDGGFSSSTPADQTRRNDGGSNESILTRTRSISDPESSGDISSEDAAHLGDSKGRRAEDVKYALFRGYVLIYYI